MNKQILILLSLLYIFNAQNIITSWHYDKVGMYILQKLSNIFEHKLLQPFKLINYPDIIFDKIKLTGIKGESISQSLYDSYLNLNNGLYLLSPYKVYFSFSFNYSITDGASGSASFDLRINQIKIKLENIKGEQKQKATISFTDKKNDFAVYAVPKEYLTQIRDALYEGFSKNKILKTIESKVNIISYFEEFYKPKKPLKIHFDKYLANKSYNVSLNRFTYFCEDVLKTYKNALCYYSGEINEDKKDKRDVVLNNTKFLVSNDSYNVFVNKDLIYKMVDDAVAKGTVFNFHKKSVKKKLNYTFTVKDLKTVFDGLDKYDEKEEFNVDIKLSSLTFFKMKGTMSFNIGTTKNVFTLEFDFSTTFIGKKEHATIINFCLNKVNEVDVKVAQGSEVKIKDLNKLKGYIISSFDPENVPLCAANKGISVSEYFNLVHSIYIKEEGIYIEGEQLYQ